MILNRLAQCLLLLAISSTVVAQSDEVRRFTSVDIDTVGGSATVRVEEGLVNQFTRAELRAIQSASEEATGEWTTITESADGAYVIDGRGLYEIRFVRPAPVRRSPTGETRTMEVWTQRVYVPFPVPENIEELAESYMPIAVFHAEETYFPQSLDEIMAHGEAEGEQVAVSRVFESDPVAIQAGQQLRSYLSFNGNSRFALTFPDEEVTCNAQDIDCLPNFYRSSRGDSDQIAVYYDASLEGQSLYLSYFFFYAFDPKIDDSSDVSAGAHVFDRESITIRLDAESGTYVPQEITYAAHLDTQTMEFNGCNEFEVCDGPSTVFGNNEELLLWGTGKTTLSWEQAPKVGNNPLTYIALGSHAVFPAPGWYTVRTSVRGIDYQYEEPAGGLGSRALVVPPASTELLRLDYTSLDYLSFSGLWISRTVLPDLAIVALGAGEVAANFPPFVRTPYAEWLVANDRSFAHCIPTPTIPASSEDCEAVSDYFEPVRGLEAYSAISFSVSDSQADFPLNDAEIRVFVDGQLLDGRVYETSAIGEFSLIIEPSPDSEYTFTVEAEGYGVFEGSLGFLVADDIKSENVALQPAPSDLSAVNVSPMEVTLNWTPAAGTVKSYRVLRDGVEIAEIDEPGYVDSSVMADVTYCYSVVAVLEDGSVTQRSNQICVTTVSTPLALAIVASADVVGRQDDPSDFFFADVATLFTMTVSNRSALTQTAVILEVVVPDFMSPRAGNASPAAQCLGFEPTRDCPPGATMQWALGDIGPGVSVEVGFADLFVADTPDGTVATVLTRVTASGLDTVEDQTSVTFRDLATGFEIGLESFPKPVRPGERLKYRLRFSNRTAINADVLTLALPDGVTFVEATQGGAVTDRAVIWPIASFPPGNDGAVEVTVLVPDMTASGSLLEAQASFGVAVSPSTAEHVVAVTQEQPLRLAFGTSVDPAEEFELATVGFWVSNAGDEALQNVVLDAIMDNKLRPSDLTEYPFSSCGAIGCAVRRWIIGEIAPGEQYFATYSGDLSDSRLALDGSVFWVHAAVSADGHGAVQQRRFIVARDQTPDFHVTVDTSQSTVLPGDKLRYRLRYSNQSSLFANYLRLSLPSGVTFLGASGGGEHFDGVVTWPSIIVPAGKVGIQEVEVSVNDDQAIGELIRADALFGVNERVATGIGIAAIAERHPLEVSVVPSLGSVEEGTPHAMTITVSNQSGEEQRSIKLFAPTPEYYLVDELSQSTPAHDCVASFNADCRDGLLMLWPNFDLAPGEQFTARYATDSLSRSARDGSTLTAAAHIAAAGLPPVFSDRKAVVRATVPPVELRLDSESGTAGPGSDIRYRLWYSNRGSLAIADTLELQLPEGVTLESVTDGGELSGHTVTWPTFTAFPGTSGDREVVVSVKPSAQFGEQIQATAIFGVNDELTVAHNSVVVNADPPLELQITTSSDSVLEGSSLTVSMMVTNVSAIVQTDVVLEALVPPFMTLDTSQVQPTPRCFNFGECPPATRVEWELGELAPGASTQVTFSAPISTDADNGALLPILGSVRANDAFMISDRDTVVVVTP